MRQRQALTVMMSGANVFLTGAPGAGKTYVLGKFVKAAQRAGKKVAVTASTGIAASHLNGTTIHSWSGLGILDRLSDEDIKRLSSNNTLLKRYNATDVLVIDEVSMLHGARLDMVNQLAKVLRSSDEPFGGLQVILVGDLFQLPPVSRGTREFDFVHLSDAWRELNPKICYITEQHRQAGNDYLLSLLEAMRSGEVDESYNTLLEERLQAQPESEAVLTRLFAHNLDVETINQRHLAQLPGPRRTYTWQAKGNKAKVEQLAKGLLTPEVLELREGAEVMFVANNFAEGFVNGSRGRVIYFDGDRPVVELLSGKRITVDQHSWSLNEDGNIRAEISQLPLRLAWAITIHKSQGMSLDAAHIDLSRTFTPGMGYVALSRVRSLDGLYLKGINRMALAMHPQIHDLDNQLRLASAQLSNTTEDMSDEVLEAAPAALVLDVVLLDKLKRWRTERAAEQGKPPYIVAHDATLQTVATAKPISTSELMALPGFGAKKIELYGSDIIKIVLDHLS